MFAAPGTAPGAAQLCPRLVERASCDLGNLHADAWPPARTIAQRGTISFFPPAPTPPHLYTPPRPAEPRLTPHPPRLPTPAPARPTLSPRPFPPDPTLSHSAARQPARRAPAVSAPPRARARRGGGVPARRRGGTAARWRSGAAARQARCGHRPAGDRRTRAGRGRCCPGAASVQAPRSPRARATACGAAEPLCGPRPNRTCRTRGPRASALTRARGRGRMHGRGRSCARGGRRWRGPAASELGADLGIDEARGVDGGAAGAREHRHARVCARVEEVGLVQEPPHDAPEARREPARRAARVTGRSARGGDGSGDVARLRQGAARACAVRRAGRGAHVGSARKAAGSMPSSRSQSAGRYTRPLRASSPTSRAMLVSCIATPRSKARAYVTAPRPPMSTVIIPPTAAATRDEYATTSE